MRAKACTKQSLSEAIGGDLGMFMRIMHLLCRFCPWLAEAAALSWFRVLQQGTGQPRQTRLCIGGSKKFTLSGDLGTRSVLGWPRNIAAGGMLGSLKKPGSKG
jgi:hypothetical protein